ncbi:MAG: hypothetical protein KJ574_03585 [Nanoarchaeota archaeon]|nr:hypothetical protein [Nanoarchaeota archaeon]
MSKVIVITEKGNVVFVDFSVLNKPRLEISGQKKEVVGIYHPADIKRGKDIVYYVNPTNDPKQTVMTMSAGKVKEAYLVEKKVA